MQSECDLFSIIMMPKNLILLFLQYKKHKAHKNTSEFHLYCWDHVYKVNGSCLVDYFYSKFRISTEIMVRLASQLHYVPNCITKHKFSACSRLLIALTAIFLQFITLLIWTLVIECLYEDFCLCDALVPSGYMGFEEINYLIVINFCKD